MNDKDKTKEQLLDEVAKLRSRVAESDKADEQRKQAEEALREKSEERYRSLFMQSPESIVVLRQNGTILDTNREVGLTGHRREELIGKKFSALGMFSESDLDALFARVLEGDTKSFEVALQTQARGQVWLEVHPALIGETVRFMSRDITDRKRAEEAIQASEKTYRDLLTNLSAGVVVHAPDTAILLSNPAAASILGLSEDQMSGIKAMDPQWKFLHEDGSDMPLDEYPVNQVLSTNEPLHNLVVGVNRPQTGDVAWVLANGFPVHDGSGQLEQVVINFVDITDRKQAEEELKESENRYTDLFKSMIDGVCQHEVVYDDSGAAVDYRILDANPQYENILNIKKSDVIGKLATEAYQADEAPYLDVYAKVAETGLPEKFETYFPPMDKYFMVSVFSPGKGKFATIFDDITHVKKAEQEKAKLEDQLHQAMKMESIGRLAGGVAHDFNNLLTAIIGYSEMIQSSLDPNDPLSGDVKEIIKAADSASLLTAQLLAFSRKQTIDPKVVHINETVQRSQKMLKRLIEEDIDLVFVPEKDLWKTKVDPGQLDQILVNLAVNARDAMPDGGKLTIETQNIAFDEEYCKTHQSTEPGEFVMLAVSDDGIGMENEVLDNIFEPFFTTKAKDKGTGLGLSTVYGIVKQHNGFVYAYSEPGKGTSFKIYLPRVRGEADVITKPDAKAPIAGAETVLLAEDNDLVRRLAMKILKKNGYRVLETENGGAAYLKCKKYEGDIHLLLTDVVMPKMNGKELYEQIASMRPGIKVLYMSGYTENAIAHRGVLDKGTAFIQKPFKADNLLRKVREVLDAPEIAAPVDDESASGKTVLVVDDEENMRMITGDHLNNNGYEVWTAKDGAEGVALFEEHADDIGLVLLDLTLPDTTGQEVLRKIRGIREDVPVILTSGYGADEIAEILKETKRTSFLQKPFGGKDLIVAVKKALQKQE